MLLPSPFPCEGPSKSSQVICYSSVSTYIPPPMASRHRPTISADIYTTCRALQDRISTNLSQSPLRSLCTPTLLPSPAMKPSAKSPIAKSPSAKSSSHRSHAPRATTHIPQAPSRGSNKRRRSISDTETRDSMIESKGHAPSTPKRQRIAPPSLPLGLVSQDFDELLSKTEPDTILPHRSRQSIDAPVFKPLGHARAPSYTQLSPSAYSSSLVSLILEKFSLREDAWTDLESRPMTLDDRWRSLMSAAELDRGSRVRREMVIRRGGRW